MTERLYQVLSRRFKNRTVGKPWVFWHGYRNRKTREWVEGPFGHRKGLMRSLCRAAGVAPFGFHALRHSGASIMEKANVPVSSIQRILGHENPTTTEIYLHSIGRAERDAMAVFEQVSQKSLTPTLTPWVN